MKQSSTVKIFNLVCDDRAIDHTIQFMYFDDDKDAKFLYISTFAHNRSFWKRLKYLLTGNELYVAETVVQDPAVADLEDFLMGFRNR